MKKYIGNIDRTDCFDCKGKKTDQRYILDFNKIEWFKFFSYFFVLYFFSCSLSQLDGCMCLISLCTFNTTFRHDQLQSIHTAKHYKQYEKSQMSSSYHSTKMTGAATVSAIDQLIDVITVIAKESIIQVLQQDSLLIIP